MSGSYDISCVVYDEYMMRYEECESATVLLENYISAQQFDHIYKPYPDIRDIKIV